jgi:hypothetical protein
VYPIASSRPLPREVAEPYASTFQEAANVLKLSPRASAALSRRLLQELLSDKGGATQKDLGRQIEFVLPSLPGYLKHLDAVRQVGNFAAHPIKSTNSGQVVPVEEGEADFLLDILEELFDFYLVQPAIVQARIDALNQKLTDAGKPEIKI